MVGVVETVVAVVGATKGAIEVVEGAIAAADRSCIIEIDNMTGDTLELADHTHESGRFQQQPPPRIEPWTHGLMSSRSTAIGQGAVGRIGFRGRDVRLDIDFGNPFVGSNRLHARVSGQRSGEFEVHTSAGGGNTGALFRCVIMHPFQDNWRFCGRCHGIFWNGPDQRNHRCPSGEVHLAAGWTFVLPHSIPEGPRVQSHFRFCSRCHGMFWNQPDSRNHRCPAGGLHHAAGLTFSLPHDLPGTPSLQMDWRFCPRCHGVFWNQPDRRNHRCAAGGLHEPVGWVFSLPHQQ